MIKYTKTMCGKYNVWSWQLQCTYMDSRRNLPLHSPSWGVSTATWELSCFSVAPPHTLQPVLHCIRVENSAREELVFLTFFKIKSCELTFVLSLKADSKSFRRPKPGLVEGVRLVFPVWDASLSGLDTSLSVISRLLWWQIFLWL